MKKKAIMIRIVLWNMSNVLVTKLRYFCFSFRNSLKLRDVPQRGLKGACPLQAGNTEAARELRAEREASTLARCEANAGREEVEDGEDNRGDCGDNDNLLNVRDLARDDDHRHRDGKALKEILDSAGEEFRCRKAVHLFLYSGSTK